MKNRIRAMIDNCARIRNPGNNMGLISGFAGSLLFDVQYQSNKKNVDQRNSTAEIQKLLDESIDYPGITFASGKAGINWFFRYLSKEKHCIDQADCDEICCDRVTLEYLSLQELKRGNWDFLHGALGIAYGLLYECKATETSSTYFEDIFKGLNNICSLNEVTGLFPNYNLRQNSFIKKEINLGLAHGIPGILKFCLECYKLKVCMNAAKKMAYKLIHWLLQSSNVNKKKNYFPSIYTNNSVSESEDSRLAWCYGDLGIGYTLYQAGILLEDHKVQDFGLEILYHASQRRTFEETMIYDAGICHGSAGVAHVFNKMWHHTDDPIFKLATDFWIQKTLDFAIKQDGRTIYKKYDPSENIWTFDSSLLEGSSGVGLVLLSYLTGDFSWDYCLMLNEY